MGGGGERERERWEEYIGVKIKAGMLLISFVHGWSCVNDSMILYK